MYNIKTYDRVANAGKKVFNKEKYKLTEDTEKPDGILVHSTPLHDMEFNPELKSIVRIGAGVNTIPVERCTEAGIAVFNCPGGNANAVKELAVAAMIMAMRNGILAMNWVKNLPDGEADAGKAVEKGKEVYRGPELMGKQIAIIGLGAIGSRMAKACDDLGMHVVGYDPYLSQSQELELRPYCSLKSTLEETITDADVVTVHIPLNEQNYEFINKETIEKMKDGVYLVNYARGPVLDNEAVSDAIDSGKIAAFATDFPTSRQMKQDKVVFTPHLGAGTPEADENCSVMAARQTIDYIENGNITNSVNLPDVSFARANGARVCVIHENKVGMLGKMTDYVTNMNLNIENLVNKARGPLAYTLLDFNTTVPKELKEAIEKIDGVIRVRVIE
jgi:D-3-phosphoglycerate dehydrogenase